MISVARADTHGWKIQEVSFLFLIKKISLPKGEKAERPLGGPPTGEGKVCSEGLLASAGLHTNGLPRTSLAPLGPGPAKVKLCCQNLAEAFSESS
jgi:hypothetical protein